MPVRISSRIRAAAVLVVCATLATVTFAAAGGAKKTSSKGDVAAAVVLAARNRLGRPYVWGATGPTSYDCSGFTSALWRNIGHVGAIPRTAAQQQAWAIPIPREQAIHGDLAFFDDPVTHVGLIIGRTKDGLKMIDASGAHRGVIERYVWSSGVVRFGRVPRPDMAPVTPWKQPPSTGGPLVKPGSPGLTNGKTPILGLPRPQLAPSSNTMRRYVVMAKKQIGSTTWTDTGLAAELWRRAGGASVHTDRASIRRATHRVLLRNAEVGDLIVYGAPQDHVGIYIGGGYMVDASKVLGKTVVRPVWASPLVTVVRWNR